MSDVFSLTAEPEKRAEWEAAWTAALENTLGSHQNLVEDALEWVAATGDVDMTRVELLYGLAAATILEAELRDRAVFDAVRPQLQERGIDLDELTGAAGEPANQ